MGDATSHPGAGAVVQAGTALRDQKSAGRERRPGERPMQMAEGVSEGAQLALPEGWSVI